MPIAVLPQAPDRRLSSPHDKRVGWVPCQDGKQAEATGRHGSARRSPRQFGFVVGAGHLVVADS